MRTTPIKIIQVNERYPRGYQIKDLVCKACGKDFPPTHYFVVERFGPVEMENKRGAWRSRPDENFLQELTCSYLCAEVVVLQNL